MGDSLPNRVEEAALGGHLFCIFVVPIRVDTIILKNLPDNSLHFRLHGTHGFEKCTIDAAVLKFDFPLTGTLTGVAHCVLRNIISFTGFRGPLRDPGRFLFFLELSLDDLDELVEQLINRQIFAEFAAEIIVG